MTPARKAVKTLVTQPRALEQWLQLYGVPILSVSLFIQGSQLETSGPKAETGLQLETPVFKAEPPSYGRRCFTLGTRFPHRKGTATAPPLRTCPGRGAATRQRERPTYLGDLQPPLPCPLAIWVPAHEGREVREGDVPRSGPELPGLQHRPSCDKRRPQGSAGGAKRHQSWRMLQGRQNRTESPEAPCGNSPSARDWAIKEKVDSQLAF